MRFQTRLIVLIASLLLGVTGALVWSFQDMAATTLRHQIGERALKIAETVALIPDIRNAFALPDPAKTIQPIAEAIRAKTGAEFVVIGNRRGIRYSHPVPDRIGEEMVGGNIRDVLLDGKSIIEQAKGTLGYSLRGKTPIYGRGGKIIGIVSVGFSTTEVASTIAVYRDKIITLGLLALIVGVIGTLLISRNVKRAILGLEPEEIGRLYQEKKAILESVREGIVAIDVHGVVITANQAACNMLGEDTPNADKADLVGRHIQQIHLNSRLPDVLLSREPQFDQQIIIKDQVIIVNSLPVFGRNKDTIGAVSSFRSKSELHRLTEELFHIREYADALRAQTHEYANKLYTISGLIQLESYREAIDFITHEADAQNNLIHFVMQEIPDPLIGGLLIGKYTRANELQVHLEIDRKSRFRDVPKAINRDHIITIMGNLIDNSLEAVMYPGVQQKKVNVFLKDLGMDLIIEVKDYGVGIPDSDLANIFKLGFSSKTEGNHGVGLALVKHAVDNLKGRITIQPNFDGGTVFTVAIPKQSGDDTKVLVV